VHTLRYQVLHFRFEAADCSKSSAIRILTACCVVPQGANNMNMNVWDHGTERRYLPRDKVSGDNLYQSVRALHRRMDEQLERHQEHALAIAELRGDVKRLAFAVLSLRPS
jgi:hypothetical protein